MTPTDVSRETGGVDAFIDFLLDYNRKVNLVSRHSTRDSLRALVSETLLLRDLVSAPLLADAGSGGGLLGIPLALALPEKRVVLAETIGKKALFLEAALRRLRLDNATVWRGPVQDFLRRQGGRECALAARGFPAIEVLADFVYRRRVRELLLISSPEKIEKISRPVANVRQTRYNIPSRDNLIIFKLENVSRETRSP